MPACEDGEQARPERNRARSVRTRDPDRLSVAVTNVDGPVLSQGGDPLAVGRNGNRNPEAVRDRLSAHAAADDPTENRLTAKLTLLPADCVGQKAAVCGDSSQAISCRAVLETRDHPFPTRA